jgi:hypothetical protein
MMKVTELKEKIKNVIDLYIEKNDGEIKGISIKVELVREHGYGDAIIVQTNVEVTATSD